MKVEEFIKKIVEEFPDLEKEVITPEMNFRDHVEWDSINALVLIAMVNVEYDVIISAQELINAATVNDVFLVVKKKVEDKAKAA
ncbi:MAG: acyl carrier protein [Bacteroidetes bacterium]|nr:MAG: acyl carrier protein [Bacteroidota bacterium]